MVIPVSPFQHGKKKMYQRFENTAFISRPCLYKKVKGVGASIPSNGWKTRMTGTRGIIPSLGAKQATLSMYRCISISETICSKIVASTPSRVLSNNKTNHLHQGHRCVLHHPLLRSFGSCVVAPLDFEGGASTSPKDDGHLEGYPLHETQGYQVGFFLRNFPFLENHWLKVANPKMDDRRFQKTSNSSFVRFFTIIFRAHTDFEQGIKAGKLGLGQTWKYWTQIGDLHK